MVVGKYTEYVGRHEFVEVIHEYFRAGYPLAVEFAPDGFSPAGIGHGEVAGGGVEVMPAGGGDYVAQRICEIVSHHLRLAGGAGSEVEQRDVAVAVHREFGFEFRCFGYSFVEIVPSFGNYRSGGYEGLYGGTFRHGLLHMGYYGLFAGTHYGFDSGARAAVYYVVGSEQVCSRDGYCSEFMESYHGKPELIAAFEDEHHHVAFAYAEAFEEGRGAVALTLDVGESEALLASVGVGPEKSGPVGFGGCPCIHHIVAEIEIIGNLHLEIAHKVVVRLEICLFKKFFYHFFFPLI